MFFEIVPLLIFTSTITAQNPTRLTPEQTKDYTVVNLLLPILELPNLAAAGGVLAHVDF